MLIEFLRNKKWRSSVMEVGHIVDIPDNEALEFIAKGSAKKAEYKNEPPKLDNKAVGLKDEDKAKIFTRKTLQTKGV